MTATRQPTPEIHDIDHNHRCAVCGHYLADHDPISHRYCQATQAHALSRGCICPMSSQNERHPPAQRERRRMFEAEDIRDWREHDVVDPGGTKIGSLEAVYFDTATEQPVFATVRVGMIGHHRLVFVPLAGATVAPKHLRVHADKKLVKDAPSIDVDGELAAAEEPAVFEHYNLVYQPGAAGERRLGRR